MPLRPRPEIENLETCPHGGPNYSEFEQLGLTPEDILDFSVSANPFGPPPGIEGAFKSAVIDRYPDSESTDLKCALANNLDVEGKKGLVKDERPYARQRIDPLVGYCPTH